MLVYRGLKKKHKFSESKPNKNTLRGPHDDTHKHTYISPCTPLGDSSKKMARKQPAKQTNKQTNKKNNKEHTKKNETRQTKQSNETKHANYHRTN